MLRTFLAFNAAFEIVLFNTFLERFHRERFAREMPLCLRNEGGVSGCGGWGDPGDITSLSLPLPPVACQEPPLWAAPPRGAPPD